MTAPLAEPPDGPFETFHPSGEPLLRGRFLGGKYDGTISKFAASTPGSEPLRNCCVPFGAIELRAEYAAGHLLSETFYDRSGQPLCADGTPWPERPPGVPEHAIFDEGSKRYCERDGSLFTPSRIRYYAADGQPAEEFEFRDGRPSLRRGFGSDGQVVEEWGLSGGKAHGAYRLRFDEETPYADERVRAEEGTFEHTENSGPMRLLDAAGELVRTLQRGFVLAGGSSPVVTGAEPRAATPEALATLEERLFAEHRTREAIAVAARILAKGRDVARFRALLEREVAELKPPVAAARARRAAESQGRTASRVLDELLGGAEPASTLRTLASSISPASPAALDYAEAAFLLAPEDGVTRVTRGLLRLEHGDREGALEDARAIRSESAPAAESLVEYARVLFPEFRFDPSDDPVTPTDEELPPFSVEQSLDAVRRTVGLYATRIGLVRDALIRKVSPNVAWLPPDTSALLPSGPVEPKRYVASITDENDEGVEEISEVPVDETFELEGRSVRGLVTLARADWAALTWLCWAAGLDRVALPEAVSPREHFASAVNRATLRCFWAQDRLKTGGLVALSHKVPTFAWQGLDIRSVPQHLVEIAAAEYLEIRALFLWLLFPVNVSPFQADLRKS